MLDQVTSRVDGHRGRAAAAVADLPSNYKWIALFISTLGMLMATIDGSIVLISLPDIFRGIGIEPLQPGNTFYLLWMILGFLVVTSVLVVSLGRMGDIYGRVRTYNLGFAVFTFFSLLLSITWMTGHAAGIWLISMRMFQGVGAAMLMANSAAILTDVFPDDQRGMALGVNQAAALSGTFIGLVLGGLLAPVNWRLIFLVSVPIGLFGTVWADLGEVPPILDQSSALGGGILTLVDEYEGPVNDPNSARRAVTMMGDASMALLAGHGVFVLGRSARAVHQRAVALEQRCQHAWYARAAGGRDVSRVPDAFVKMVARGEGEGFIGFWEAAVRAELVADPGLLDS